MEQFLGQFLTNILSSIEAGTILDNIFQGFIFLGGFTLLAYLVFRIAFLALKVGTILAVLSVALTMGSPNMDLGTRQKDQQIIAPKRDNFKEKNNLKTPNANDLLSGGLRFEEKLRELFLSYILKSDR